MKNLKILLFALLLTTLFTSCQRNYTCVCTMMQDGSTQNVKVSADSKTGAKAECDHITSTIYAGQCVISN